MKQYILVLAPYPPWVIFFSSFQFYLTNRLNPPVNLDTRHKSSKRRSGFSWAKPFFLSCRTILIVESDANLDGVNIRRLSPQVPKIYKLADVSCCCRHWYCIVWASLYTHLVRCEPQRRRRRMETAVVKRTRCLDVEVRGSNPPAANQLPRSAALCWTRPPSLNQCTLLFSLIKEAKYKR